MATTPSRRDGSRDRSLLPSPARLGLNTTNLGIGSASPSPSPSSARPRLSVDVHSPTPSVHSDSGRKDKRLPSLPSPLAGKKEWALGAYDNKLVSSTLSQLPPLPPLPPLSPSGISSTGSNLSSFSHASTSPNHQLAPTIRSTPSLISVSMPRPAPPPPSAGGVLVLPDGTALPTGADGGQPERLETPSVSMTMAHSSPSSPWSLLTVHVLPLFAGSPLKTAIEDLNHLCNSHIVTTSQRTPASRLLGVLTADLRDFIASGMLTLKAKFDTIDEAKVVSRAAEVWSFFWGQILPYVEGVFLPLSQVRDIPTSATARQPAVIVQQPPIAVRHILLSGFLVHILLPLLPRLIPLVAALPPLRDRNSPSGPDLPRLLQMSLVLSTQARYSSFYTPREPGAAEAHDLETSESVDELGRAVRWSMMVVMNAPTLEDNSLVHAQPGGGGHERSDSTDTPKRPGLQRAPSLSQAGRIRRRTRGSGSISALEPDLRAHLAGIPPGGDAGGGGGGGGRREVGGGGLGAQWGRIDEDDEDEPRYRSLAPSAATTLRGESVATLTDRTPTHDRARLPAAAAAKMAAAAAARRHARKYSSGESDLSSVFSGINHRARG